MFKLSKSKRLNLAKIYHSASDSLASFPFIAAARRRKRFLKIIKIFSYGLLLAAFVFIIFFARELILFKNFYGRAQAGRQNFKQALALSEASDWPAARLAASQASADFSFANDSLSELRQNFIFKRTTTLKRQLNELTYLLASAETASRGVGQAAQFVTELELILPQSNEIKFTPLVVRPCDFCRNNEQIDYSLPSTDRIPRDQLTGFTALSQEEKKAVLEKIYRKIPDLVGIKANFDLAQLNLKNVAAPGLIFPWEKELLEYRRNLTKGGEIVDQAINLAAYFPLITGYPQNRNYLILIRDSRQLGPLGGLPRYLGELSIGQGQLAYLKFRRFDGPALSSASNSADWQFMARGIIWQQETLSAGPFNNFDGVISLPETLVADLLDLFGYLEVNDQLIDKIKFNNLFYESAESLPPDLFGRIFKEMIDEILNLPTSYYPELAEIINRQIFKNNISFYFKDSTAANLAAGNNLSGGLKEADGDYFQLNEITDKFIKPGEQPYKTINYSVSQGVNGLFSDLVINIDPKDNSYRDLIKIYLPAGSTFLRTGEAEEQLMEISNELNKTTIAVAVSLEPRQFKTINIKYKLPDRLSQLAKKGLYSLYVQKQPDNTFAELKVDVRLENSIKSYNPTGFYAEKIFANRVKWESDLASDRFFEVGF